MVRILFLGAILAGAYWYWSGPYQDGRPGGRDAQLQENARKMEQCIRRERSITAGAGMVGADPGSGDPQELCALQLNLYQQDGQWHSFDRE
jgi:hypothetical protein